MRYERDSTEGFFVMAKITFGRYGITARISGPALLLLWARRAWVRAEKYRRNE